jgi:hypothetical protein
MNGVFLYYRNGCMMYGGTDEKGQSSGYLEY